MLEDAVEKLKYSNTPYEVPPARARQSHPKGFEPGVDFKADGSRIVTTPPMGTLATEDEWKTAIDSLGISVPDGWRVRVVEMRYDPAAWHRDKGSEGAAYTAPVWRYRFAVEEQEQDGGADIQALLDELKWDRVRKPAASDAEGTFVISWNDWQLYSNEGDGIEGTVRRIYDSFDAVENRIKALRKMGRKYPRLLIVATGDIVDGCYMRPNHAWDLQGDSRDQENTARRLIVAGIKQFVPLFESIQVLAVGGNHGENREGGKKNNRHDNTDVKVFEQVADIFAETEYSKVLGFSVPREALSATIEVEGWILAATHGHLAGKSAGGPEAKLKRWFDGQAAGKLPAGDADILLTSHYHHPRLADWGGCFWLQAPAMDGGSEWLTESTGAHSKPGLLTFGVTPEERVTDIAFTNL